MRKRLVAALMAILAMTGVASTTPASATAAAAPTPTTTSVPARKLVDPATFLQELAASSRDAKAPPYFICSRRDTNKCLDADTNTAGGNGTKVQLWQYNGQHQQRWYFDDLGGGNLMIWSVYSGRYLDADLNAMCCNGTKVQLWDHVPGNLNQTWYFIYDGEGIRYQNNHPPHRQLDADLNTFCCNGTKVQIWDHIPGANNQQWLLYTLA